MEIMELVVLMDSEQQRIADDRDRLELAKLLLTDSHFCRRVKHLRDNPLELAHEIIDGERNRWLNTAIEDVDFSVRTFNCLKKAGLNTLGEVITKAPDELLHPAIRNFGQRCLDEVVKKLAEFGLKLKEPEQPQAARLGT